RAHREPARADEIVAAEIGMEADHARERRQRLLHQAHRAALLREMIDDDDARAALADAAQLGAELRRVVHHRYDMKRDRGVETVVIITQPLGIALFDRLDLAQA